MSLSNILYTVVLGGLLVSPALAQEEDVLAQARKLATSSHRKEALQLLQNHLDQSPRDVDARLLYGLVFSWEWRWDDARTQLQQVLEQSPKYTDAVIALINVELWSDHPAAAEEIVDAALSERQDDLTLLWMLSRVKRALKRPQEEKQILQEILLVDPENADALDRMRNWREENASWDTGIAVNSILYGDHSSPWKEESISIRKGVSAGSMIFRFSRAYRFGYTSNLAEMDWYPKIRPGTYAYINAGYSPEGILYPTFRAGADLYHNWGRGFESSVGIRYLSFSSSKIKVYTGSLGRYHKNWYVSARTFITPGDPGTSGSVQLNVRRYFDDGERYVGFTWGRGAAPFEIRSTNEVGVLDSASYSSEMYWRFGAHILFGSSGGWGLQDRAFRTRTSQTYFSVNLKYRL